jgi:transposase InsO family protein
MPTVFSKPTGENSQTMRQWTKQQDAMNPPPISYYAIDRYAKTNAKSSDVSKDEAKERAKLELREFEIKLDLKDEKSESYKASFQVFADGTPYQWCKWRESMDELMLLQGVTQETDDTLCANKQHKLFLAMMDGKCKDEYLKQHQKLKAENLTRSDENIKPMTHVMQQVINETAKLFFDHWKKAVRDEKRYMRIGLYMGDISPKTFVEKLEKLNKMLKYYPVVDPTKPTTLLDDDELLSILLGAKKPEWNIEMLRQGKGTDSFETLAEAQQYFQALHDADDMKKKQDVAKKPKNDTTADSTTASKKKKRKRRQDGDNGDNGGRADISDRAHKCEHCGKAHKSSNCWSLPQNANKRPKWFNKPNPVEHTNKIAMTQQQFSMVIDSMLKKDRKDRKKKRAASRQLSIDSDSNVNDAMDNYLASLSQDNESSPSSKHYFEHYNPISLRDMLEPNRQKRQKTEHYTAELVAEIEDRNGKIVPIRALIDTGTTATIVLRQFVRSDVRLCNKAPPTWWHTRGGNFVTHRRATLDFTFPELNATKCVTWQCHIDHKTDPLHTPYDMIIGLDLQTEIGIYVNTDDKQIHWEGATIPLKTRGELDDSQYLQMLYEISTAPEAVFEAEERQARIADANYEKVDVDAYVQEISNLDDEQKCLLAQLLKRHPTLFGGGLGVLNIKPIHLELKEGTTPYHARPFPVPQSLSHTTKTEIDRLTNIGVFEKNYGSEWAAPTFVQPKKTGDVRILTDFRRLNAQLKRNPFPLPKINDLLQRLSGFRFATALDLSMGYYHIPLDEESSRLCTTILPWGKYQYKRLPMGIKNSPDIFQSIMQDLLGDLEYVQAYIDDILITSSDSWEDHLAKCQTVLERLENAGFRANLHKCFFGRDELEYLGYWLTRDGLQPQPKKVEAILRLAAPTTKRQLRHFLGMVNFYRDMWKRRSHILAPLTGLVSNKVSFVWGAEQQEAFDAMKAAIAKETLLVFPDFNEEFHVHTDASNYQLGAVISQNGKPLAFYSRKLNPAQQRYTTGEQELLGIVETLKEFRNILFGQKVIVHTDHKNILYGNLSNDRIARWRLLLEEYSPEYRHVSGKDNIVADALSRLPRDESIEVPEPNDMEAMAETFLTVKELEENKFPMNPALIQREQQNDKKLQKSLNKSGTVYRIKRVEEQDLVTYNGKIVIPSSLRLRILAWYHEYLAHPGMTRLEASLRQVFTWPKLSADVEQYVRTCKKCQLNKAQRKKYGKIPLKKAETSVPWNRVDVDMIGPWTVKAANGTFKLQALTMIDPATGWFEVKDVNKPDADTCQKVFDDVWLSRYPRPEHLGFDGGSEYKAEFNQLRANYGLKRHETTAYNPQSNGIIERVHKVLGDALRTFELSGQNLDDDDPWTPFLSAAAYAIRSTYHTTLQASPAQLVFGRDMLLPLKFKVDWARVKQRRQTEMARNNQRENRSRLPHKYRIGDLVLVEVPGVRAKLTPPRKGPYKVVRVYTNGTVRIQRGAISQRINLRRLSPFFERDGDN